MKPGDRWTYVRHDYLTNEPTRLVHETVTFANERAIHVVAGKQEDVDATYTAEWNLVSSRNSGVFYPDQGLFRFPMRPGDTHEARYEAKFPTRGAYDVRHNRRVKVIGWEDVTVPAGRFRALRVESEGSFERIDRNLSGTAKDVMWYAPQAKRYVKWTYEASTRRGPLQSWGFELVEYRLQ